MNATPFDMQPWRVDPIELAHWNTANTRARLEYQTHPTISQAICEHCGRKSVNRYCDRCRMPDQEDT